MPSSLTPISLAGEPTPLHPMARLEAALGLEPGRLWVKRDDLTALAGGGNKARKLEYLCAAAREAGADVLVTAGAVQSNHVRMTAAAAAMLGFAAVGVVGGRRTEVPEGNVVLDAVFGIELVYANETYGALDLDEALAAECARQRDLGRRPYSIPLGGSSPVGVRGYLAAAEEIQAELGDCVVYLADGTGGTHAGLAAGFGTFDRVIGVDVGAVPQLEGFVGEVARAAADLAGISPPTGSPRIDTSQVGDGYGRPTPEGLDAIRVAGRTEGLILDPVYTSKAFAALLADARSGRLGDAPAVFLHTGGLPGLFVARHAARLAEA